MVQIENEYGSYGNDRNYLERLRQLWQQAGIPGPFYTADGASNAMLEAGSLPGAAVGLQTGATDANFDLARRLNPGVPVFTSEIYPGWLTHWGEKWQRPDPAPLLRQLQSLLDARRSFNLYVVHGGTNFGFTAGANSGGKGYEPDVTSCYDYDAPIDEQGRATPKFQLLRDLLAGARNGAPLPEIPAPIPAAAIPPIAMRAYASIWSSLPAPIAAAQPRPMESFGQYHGLMVYETTLVGQKSGALVVTDLHDYATIFVDGKYIGKLDRRRRRRDHRPPAHPSRQASAHDSGGSHGPHQFRAIGDRSQRHHRQRHTQRHDADELARLPAPRLADPGSPASPKAKSTTAPASSIAARSA